MPASGEIGAKDGSESSAVRLIEKGNALEDAGRLHDALTHYAAAVKLAPNSARAHLNRGNALLALGDAEAAAIAYSTALTLDPAYVAARYNLGNAYLRLSRRAEAVAAYREALVLKPDFADAAVALGVAYEELGQRDDAAASYRRALEIDPAGAGAQFNLGNLLYDSDQIDEAIGCYRRAIELDTRLSNVRFRLGIALRRRKRYAEAIDCYQQLLEEEPRNALTHNELGMTFEDLGRHDEAIASFGQALSFFPDSPASLFNLGNSLAVAGRLEEAVQSYERALALKPDFAEAELNLGNAQFNHGRVDPAIAAYRRALVLKPDFAEAHAHLGTALTAKHLIDPAIEAYRTALAIKPDLVDALLHLGSAFLQQDRCEEARRSFDRVIALNPDKGDARWSLVAAQLPAVRESNEDPDLCRGAFSRELENFERWCGSRALTHAFDSFRIQTQFYLAYNEENNRDLIRRHGNVCARIAAAQAGMLNVDVVRAHGADRRIRVGVVSHHFRSHSVWHAIVKGWFQNLDRNRFELHAFHLETREDAQTQFVREHADYFEQGKRDLRQWVDTLARHEPDVLIYPEIGMEFMAAQLASLRLAPVQAAAWGHPETTGLPTIDYYLSAAGMEPPNAQENYVERLVMLPNLGCFNEPFRIEGTPPDLAKLGIDPAAPLLICPGVPYKYAPEHDAVFPEIARRLGRCQFLFFHFPNSPKMSEKLRHRLRGEFARNGLDFDRFVVFVPWQESPEFIGLFERADIFLDTIGFSGFNTAMKALECGLPIVTREGRFLRGRLASGLLRRIGLDELVVQSDDDYVALAVRLATDADYLEQVGLRIETSRHLVFSDKAAITGLEDFLVRAVGEAS